LTALLVSRRPGRPLSHRFLYVLILETLLALSLLQVALVSLALPARHESLGQFRLSSSTDGRANGWR
jgi:hypothetical protein